MLGMEAIVFIGN